MVHDIPHRHAACLSGRDLVPDGLLDAVDLIRMYERAEASLRMAEKFFHGVAAEEAYALLIRVEDPFIAMRLVCEHSTRCAAGDIFEVEVGSYIFIHE